MTGFIIGDIDIETYIKISGRIDIEQEEVYSLKGYLSG